MTLTHQQPREPGKPETMRMEPAQWDAVWNDDRPWVEGEALQIAFMIGLQLRPGDHVIVGDNYDVQGEEYRRGMRCIAESYWSERKLWMVRHGPAPGQDWGVWLRPDQIKAYRPRKEKT